MKRTKVMFRKDWNGDVYALFPEIAATVGNPAHCLSYQHIGQHCAADYQLCIRASKPAKSAEYAELFAELTTIGYSLEVIQRATAGMYRQREAEAVALDVPELGASVDAKTFRDAVHQVGAAVSSRNSLPILGHVLIEPVCGGIKLTATDLELGASVTIHALTENFEPCTVPARLLADALKGASGCVSIRNEGDDVRLTIGGSEQVLKGIMAAEFPQLAEVEVKTWVKFPGLAGILKRLMPAVSDDEYRRAILTGILIDGKNIVSTDTNRLFVYEHGMDLTDLHTWPQVTPEVEAVPGGRSGIVIPGTTCDKLMRMLGCKPDAEVEIGCSDTQVIFKVGDSVVRSRLIEGMFPNYERVIPDEAALTGAIEVIPGDMAEALKKVWPVARENSGRALFTVEENDLLKLSASSSSCGEVSAMIDGCRITGFPIGFQFAMSCNYLADAVAVFKNSELVTLSGSGAVNQFTVTSRQDPDMLVVVMPMQIGY